MAKAIILILTLSLFGLCQGLLYTQSRLRKPEISDPKPQNWFLNRLGLVFNRDDALNKKMVENWFRLKFIENRRSKVNKELSNTKKPNVNKKPNNVPKLTKCKQVAILAPRM